MNSTTSSKITKEKFCEAIEQLRAANDLKDQIDQMIFTEVDVESDFLSGYGLSVDHAGLVSELLELLMDDKGEWISYYCWEMDFGRDLRTDSVTEENGEPIDISTPEKLYDFLVEQCL